MKANQLNELAGQVLAAVMNQNAQPIKTRRTYGWQDVDVLENDNEHESLEGNVSACATIYETTGTVVFSLTIAPSESVKANVLEALKRLRAKNLVQLATESKIESQEKENEANELLNEAAELLGIPVADLKTEGVK